MTWWERTALVVFMVLFMECFAWAMHKYVMHGWGWGWHKSHHEPHDNAVEKNDLYAVVFAIVPIALFTVGMWYEPLWWIALGITIYGAIYAFVHDMLVHQRGGFRWVPRHGYFKRLLQAHRLHHAVEGREGTVSHGFLFARNPAVLKEQLRRHAAKRVAAPAVGADRDVMAVGASRRPADAEHTTS
jgi:beta-carotene 3-hydroxylase